jgi:hypothetical protein
MTHTTPTARPFTAHQRFQALYMVDTQPGLDEAQRAALRQVWTAIWHTKTEGDLLWADHFRRVSASEGYWADGIGVGLESLINAWRTVAGLGPVDRHALDHPTNTKDLASSVLVPLESVAATIGVHSNLSWFPPAGNDVQGILIVALRPIT